MKLLNRSIRLIAIPVLIVIALWAVVFYFSIYREIKSSVDEGLDNYKRQIVFLAQSDSAVLQTEAFNDGFYAIRSIDEKAALNYKDIYKDTLMYMQDADDPYPKLEPARLLSTAFELEGSYYELKVIQSMIEADDLVKQLFWNTLWLFAALFLTMLLVNRYALQRLWKPFYIFLSRLKSYRLGTKEGFPEIKTGITEFQDLQSAVTTLLKHNTSLFEQQKQFIGNASHELQTPLAIAVSKLELLIEEGNLGNSQAQNISETISIIERLIRTNKSLLLLSKIENRQFMDNQPVDINHIVKQSIQDLSEIIQYKEVSVSTEENSSVETVMDASLANIAVSNLIRNSIFHNIPQGKVQISLNDNRLTICNSGSPEPLQTKDMFSRFYKSEGKSHGTGLGLAIVKAICDLYGYRITYQFRENRHCFEINFKK